MIRYKKDGRDGQMLLSCSYCGSEQTNVKDLIMHKKEMHGVRVNDAISSLETLGIDDPQLFAQLREEYRNEKYSVEWKRQARDKLKEHLRQNDFLQNTKIPLR